MDKLPQSTLLNHVFRRLSYKERRALGFTCRRLRALCDQSFKGMALDIRFGQDVRVHGTLAGLLFGQETPALRYMLRRGAGLREAEDCLCRLGVEPLIPLLTESPAYTAHLRRLRLDLLNMDEDSFARLPLLAGCPSLEDVSITTDMLEDDDPLALRPTHLSFLGQLPRLQKLHLTVPPSFSLADVTAIVPCSSLSSLSIAFVGDICIDGWLDSLPVLSNMTDFTLAIEPCYRLVRLPWSKFPSLRHLDVSRVLVDPASCKKPIHLPNLDSLCWSKSDDRGDPMCNCASGEACNSAHLSSFAACLNADSQVSITNLTVKIHGFFKHYLLDDLEAVAKLTSLQRLHLDLNPDELEMSETFPELSRLLDHSRLPKLAHLTLHTDEEGRACDIFLSVANLPALESITVKGVKNLSPSQARTSARLLLRALAHPLRLTELPLRVWVTQKKDADAIAAAAAKTSPAVAEKLSFEYYVRPKGYISPAMAMEMVRRFRAEDLGLWGEE